MITTITESGEIEFSKDDLTVKKARCRFNEDYGVNMSSMSDEIDTLVSKKRSKLARYLYVKAHAARWIDPPNLPEDQVRPENKLLQIIAEISPPRRSGCSLYIFDTTTRKWVMKGVLGPCHSRASDRFEVRKLLEEEKDA